MKHKQETIPYSKLLFTTKYFTHADNLFLTTDRDCGGDTLHVCVLL